MHALHHARAAIERRQAVHKGEDALTAAFHVVESLTADQCAAILRETLNQPLCRDDADVVQLAAQRAGVQVAWKHCVLTTGEWGEGRRGQ